MNEQNLIDDIAQFFEWYQQVYDSEIILENPVSLPEQNDQTLPATEKRRPGKQFAKVVTYKQTSPELQAFYEQIKDCQKCDLHKTRKNFVFGYGNAHAEVMFVGEAPGRDEDEQGLPFVGVSGKLLDKIFAAIDLKREDVYIANVIKCRPPNNRNPKPEEIAQCEPYLIQQIDLIKPKLIVALGLFAANTLLKAQRSLSELRKKEHSYQGIPLIVTYHPSALLRKPILKAESWKDFKKIRAFLNEIER